MERIKKVLKESSHYVHHPNNMAKEYALFDDGRFLEIGKGCFIHGGRNIYTIIEDDDSFKAQIEEDKYCICYGINLSNIVYLLKSKDVDVLCISRVVEEYNNYFVITTKSEHGYSPKSFRFKETTDLEDFEHTELGDYICSLYGF